MHYLALFVLSCRALRAELRTAQTQRLANQLLGCSAESRLANQRLGCTAAGSEGRDMTTAAG